VCEEYPCSRKDFKGSWEDRFNYDYVKKQYDKAFKVGKIDTFNQELMLRIMSDEDRLIQNCDIRWYKREHILQNRGNFNFYITTDLATSAKAASDYSVIFVWAYNNAGQWFWVDGIVKKQKLGVSIDDLFRLAQEYSPQSVGIEVSGQQEGFIDWIQEQQLARNIYFPFASDGNKQAPGIRPVTDKFARFGQTQPWFQMQLMHFPIEKKDSLEIKETMNEIELCSNKGPKSKHDDCLDGISMLTVMKAWKPSQVAPIVQNPTTSIWEMDMEDEGSRMDSYVV
jgi:predicted phage terminase large subunit-like protein